MSLASTTDLYAACKYAIKLEDAGYIDVHLELGDGVVHIHGIKVPVRRKK